MTSLPDHLGGQWAGTVDTGIVTAIRDDLGVASLLDIGCGDGTATRQYESIGLRVTGIDGDWSKLPEGFVLHDFTQGPIEVEPHDLAYSVEFLEHLEERYLDHVMPLFSRCRYAVVTAALPGQPGHHHVNCQPPEYWKRLFAEWGMAFDAIYTERLKGCSTMCKASGPKAGRPIRFFQRTGMFFRV